MHSKYIFAALAAISAARAIGRFKKDLVLETWVIIFVGSLFAAIDYIILQLK